MPILLAMRLKKGILVITTMLFFMQNFLLYRSVSIDPASTPSGSSHMEAFCFNSPWQRDLSCSNSPHGPQHFCSKRRRVEDIDSIFWKSLLESLEKHDLKDKTKEMGKTNPDLYDCLEIAETLSKFTSRQRAMAKVNIHQMLFKI